MRDRVLEDEIHSETWESEERLGISVRQQAQSDNSMLACAGEAAERFMLGYLASDGIQIIRPGTVSSTDDDLNEMRDST
jgi:hypothetical protein